MMSQRVHQRRFALQLNLGDFRGSDILHRKLEILEESKLVVLELSEGCPLGD